jgi:hypothetical protein
MDTVLTATNEVHDFFQPVASFIYLFRTPHTKSYQVYGENHCEEQRIVSIVERTVDENVIIKRSLGLFHVSGKRVPISQTHKTGTKAVATALAPVAVTLFLNRRRGP